jgi:negative regulator of replication initiation
MKKLISVLGGAVVAAVSGVTVYLYMTDDEVRAKVDTAVYSVGEAASEIGRRVASFKDRQAAAAQTADERNQAWVDQQWEVLGI